MPRCIHMPAKRKLTNQLVAKIQKRAKAGATYTELQAEFGISRGSVQNAVTGNLPKSVRAPKVQKKVIPSEPDSEADDAIEELSSDDVRVWLGMQVRDLRGECRKLKAEGPPQAYAAASRNLTMTSLAYARLTPKPAEDPALNPDMVQAAEECRMALHALLDRVLEDPQHPFLRLRGTGSGK